jgi:hypothetical protein
MECAVMHQKLVILYSVALNVQLHKMEEIISVQNKWRWLQGVSQCEPGNMIWKYQLMKHKPKVYILGHESEISSNHPI